MTINLLPNSELREYYDRDLTLKKAAIAIIVPVVIMCFIFPPILISRHAQAQRLKKLEEKYSAYVAIEAEVKKNKDDLAYLHNRSKLLENVLPEKFYWSEKLVALAKTIPPQAWIHQLSIQNDGLSINGFIYSERAVERPLEILNKFIKALNTSEDFANDFKTIALIDVKTGTGIDDKQILEFNLLVSVK
jgi:Tfp pilus assembly protein PilN